MLRRLVVRCASSSSKVDKLHKEEYLAVARNYPHEEYAPSSYNLNIEPAPQPTAETLKLIASCHDTPPEASFNSKTWRNSLIVLLVFGITVRTNQWYMSDKEEHPITTFLAKYQSAGVDAIELDKQSIPRRQQYAEDMLILGTRPWNGRYNPVSRWSFSHHERNSEFNRPIGSRIDFSDVEAIHDYDELDK